MIATGITAIGLAVAAAAAFPSTDASTARRHVRCELGSLPTATAVTISPDGRAVAYEIDRTIEIRRLNGRLARVLNRDQGPVTIAQIAWSPDTEYLAVVEESSYGASLVVWNAMHGSLPVTFRSVDGFGGWTPDNQLFFRQRYGPNSFVLLDPRSARETRVGAFGSLSPDGRRVAHWEADGLAVETIFGTDRRLIASGTAQATQVTWSPDGTRLAWGEVPTGHLRIIRDNGADQRVVIPFVRDADAARVSPPYWTPAGIYFSATRQLGRPSLAFLADPGTGEVKRVGAVAPTPGSGSSIASVSARAVTSSAARGCLTRSSRAAAMTSSTCAAELPTSSPADPVATA